MTDRKIADEMPEDADSGPLNKKGGWLRGTTRGLHLQQIDELVEEDAYEGVGADMRAERQRRNLALSDVSATLRIQQTYLAALEGGRTDDLPGPTYAIGFLRTYSEFLGLDGDEIIRQFKREATLTPVERRLVFPEPLEEARRPGLSLALMSLLVAGAVYGGWIFLEQRDLVPIETVAEPPQRLAPYKAATDAVKPLEAAPQKVTAPATATDTAPAIAPVTAPAIAPVTATADTAAATVAPAPSSSETGAGAAQTEQMQATPGSGETGDAGTVAPVAPVASMQPEKAPEQSVTQSIGQSAGQASEQASEQASDQVAAAGQTASGERAAASDVSGLANTANSAGTAVESNPAVSIGEMPVTANTVAPSGETASEKPGETPNETPVETTTETATETASNASDSAGQQVAGAQTTPAEIPAETPVVATLDATMAQPDVQDASPLPLPAREGSDVDTAPAMPSIQAAIAPPPPAAPVAPARPLSESSGEEARDSGAGGASSAATSDNLGYRPQIYGASNRNVRVVLRARAESWVQIQGANNELLLTRMLRPGDSYHAPDRTDLVLMTGNAGAIEIMVDGEALGTLGPMGQVRRNIKLNADQLRGEMRPTESERPEVR